MRFADPGVRDPDNICESYRPVARKRVLGVVDPPWGSCDTDGHYLCKECVHRTSPERLSAITGYPEVEYDIPPYSRGDVYRRYLAELGEEALIMDGFDRAILGVVRRVGQEPFLVYDRERCLDILTGKGMSREEAEEHFAFNCEGYWSGSGTPGVLVQADENTGRNTLGGLMV